MIQGKYFIIGAYNKRLFRFSDIDRESLEKRLQPEQISQLEESLGRFSDQKDWIEKAEKSGQPRTLAEVREALFEINSPAVTLSRKLKKLDLNTWHHIYRYLARDDDVELDKTLVKYLDRLCAGLEIATEKLSGLKSGHPENYLPGELLLAVSHALDEPIESIKEYNDSEFFEIVRICAAATGVKVLYNQVNVLRKVKEHLQ